MEKINLYKIPMYFSNASNDEDKTDPELLKILEESLEFDDTSNDKDTMPPELLEVMKFIQKDVESNKVNRAIHKQEDLERNDESDDEIDPELLKITTECLGSKEGKQEINNPSITSTNTQTLGVQNKTTENQEQLKEQANAFPVPNSSYQTNAFFEDFCLKFVQYRMKPELEAYKRDPAKYIENTRMVLSQFGSELGLNMPSVSPEDCVKLMLGFVEEDFKLTSEQHKDFELILAISELELFIAKPELTNKRAQTHEDANTDTFTFVKNLNDPEITQVFKGILQKLLKDGLPK